MMKNHEGYHDPTAGKAIRRACRSKRRRRGSKTRPLTYLIGELQDPDDPDSRVPLEKMKKVYYHARGWNRDGLPTERTLRKLKILQDTRRSE